MIRTYISIAMSSSYDVKLRMQAIEKLKVWIDGEDSKININGQISTDKPSLVDLIDVNKLTMEDAEFLDRILKHEEEESE